MRDIFIGLKYLSFIYPVTVRSNHYSEIHVPIQAKKKKWGGIRNEYRAQRRKRDVKNGMYLYIMMWDSIEEKRERWQKIKK